MAEPKRWLGAVRVVVNKVEARRLSSQVKIGVKYAGPAKVQRRMTVAWPQNEHSQRGTVSVKRVGSEAEQLAFRDHSVAF